MNILSYLKNLVAKPEPPYEFQGVQPTKPWPRSELPLTLSQDNASDEAQYKGTTMNFILLISTIISSIKSVELLMPSSAGADKLNAVIIMIEGVMGSVAPLLPAITSIIATLVAGFNAVGIFSKKAA